MTNGAIHIHINGIVQGVGFRPFIYTLAEKYHLLGWVRNSANGVDIEVAGPQDVLETFVAAIPHSAPPLAQIDSIETTEIEPQDFPDFRIVHSKNKSTDFIPISPDIAICNQCLDELFNPEDRRYRYPFINCTNCGPRFTIIKDIPYDRPNTTMSGFALCPDCREEYENPLDRRFHAQPVACQVCGPQVWIEDNVGETFGKEDEAIRLARQILADGKILAIKGLGGFHLACDAANLEAVSKLRMRKHRPAKPFALMAANTETIKKFVTVSDIAEALLTNPQAPIVLLPKKNEGLLSEDVAPAQSTLGFMLPYTPLHQLLLQPGNDTPQALVMTSGNLSEEPILHENQPAREKLSHIADAFLLHNRPIHRRIDDSVFNIVDSKPYPIRRARGYAPNPIRVSQHLPQILAVGPQMKNTFCLTREKYAFLSHYIGEMENWETYQDFQKAVRDYENLFRIKPVAIAYDMHPGYTTSKYAKKRAESEGLPSYAIQHHHAHLASVLAENDIPPDLETAGLIFDGTGYGMDGTIWGGEVLIGNRDGFSRIFHLKPVPLPGGEASILKPARMALSILWAYDLPWEETLAPVQALSTSELSILEEQLEKKINTPMTSSMGRLFDAVAALIGVRELITYEAQAAIELEALADRNELGYYPWKIEEEIIDVKTVLLGILADFSHEVPTNIISARFHNTIAQISLNVARQIRQDLDIEHIALSGGVWQNKMLLEKTLELLRKEGFHPLIHQQMPPNDGCVAFGQAMIAAYRYKVNKE